MAWLRFIYVAMCVAGLIILIHRGFPLDRNELFETAKEFTDSLRDGTIELLNELSRLSVPVMVFSAGFGDMVHAVLKEANVMLPNVKVNGCVGSFG